MLCIVARSLDGLVTSKFNCREGCFTKFVRPQCIIPDILEGCQGASGCIFFVFGNPSCPGEAMDLLTSMARSLCGFVGS